MTAGVGRDLKRGESRHRLSAGEGLLPPPKESSVQPNALDSILMRRVGNFAYLALDPVSCERTVEQA